MRAETTARGGQAHSNGPAETQHRSNSLKDLPAAGSAPEGQGSEGGISRKERAGRLYFPYSPSAQLFRCSWEPGQIVHLPHCQLSPAAAIPCAPAPPSPAVVQLCCLADRVLEGASSKISRHPHWRFSFRVMLL